MTSQLTSSFHKLFLAADEESKLTVPLPPPQVDTSDYVALYSSTREAEEGSGERSAPVNRFQLSQSDIERLRVVPKKITLQAEDDDVVLGRYAPHLLHSHRREPPSGGEQKASAESAVNQQKKGSDDGLILPLPDWTEEVKHVMLSEEQEKRLWEEKVKDLNFLPDNDSLSDSEPPPPPSAGSVGAKQGSGGGGGNSGGGGKAGGRPPLRGAAKKKAPLLPPPATTMMMEDLLFQRCHQLEKELLSATIYHNDLIDLDQEEDPLDRLIPNEQDEQEEEEEAKVDAQGLLIAPLTQQPQSEQPPNAQSKSTRQTARYSLFAHHARNHRPLSSEVTFEDDTMTSKFERDKQRKLEKAQRIRQVHALFDTTSILIKSAHKRSRDAFTTGRSGSGGAGAGGVLGSRSSLTTLHHSPLALQHRNSKADLQEVELKYFHRPRMIRERDRPWVVRVPAHPKHKDTAQDNNNSAAGKKSSASGASWNNRYGDGDMKQNLSLVAGGGGGGGANGSQGPAPFILLEYIEEFPPIMMNYGMASVMLNYYRSMEEGNQEGQDEAGGGDPVAKTSRTASTTTPTATTGTTSVVAKKKEESKVMSTTDVARLSQLVEESPAAGRLPRHVLLLASLRNEKRSYYDYDASIPRLRLGQTKVLTAEDESPFLGEIAPGEIQPALSNNLFRAPLFPHSPTMTDFLLIRTKLTSKELYYDLREIPYLYLAGQIEPQRIVPRPVFNKMNPTQENYLRLAILRYLITNSLMATSDSGGHGNTTNNMMMTTSLRGVIYEDLYRSVLKYLSKEKASPHKTHHRQRFKDLLKAFATEEMDDSDGLIKWFPLDYVVNSSSGGGAGSSMMMEEVEDSSVAGGGGAGSSKRWTLESLIKEMTPEDVCLQEACNAAEYRLFHQDGVVDIALHKVQAYLHYMHKVKAFAEQRIKSLRSLSEDFRLRQTANTVGAITSSSSSLLAQGNSNNAAVLHRHCLSLIDILDQDLRRLEKKLSIARLIFDRLLAAPWNTTEAFVRTVLDRDLSQGRMVIQGVGDPSGRGEGFAFVRLPRLHLTSHSQGGAGAAAGGAGGAPKKVGMPLVGTDKDLRKLTKEDAIRLLVALGVKRPEAEALKRWDRIHMIREMVNKMDKMGVIPKDLQKYVRDPNHNNMAYFPPGSAGGVGGGGGAGGVGEESEEVFHRKCQEIWDRQRAALSLRTTPMDNTLSKQAKKRLQLQQQHQQSQGVAGGEKEQLKQQEEEESDEDLDLEGALEARRAARMSLTSSHGGAGGGGVTSMPSAKEEVRKHKEEEDRRELGQLTSWLGQQTTTTTTTTITAGSGGNGTQPMDSTQPLDPIAAPPPHPSSATSVATENEEKITYPRRVVRRLTRVLHADGSESVTIDFLFSPSDLRRVEQLQLKQAKERQQRRANMTAWIDSRRLGGSGKGPAGGMLGEEEEDAVPIMTLKVGRMKAVAASASSSALHGSALTSSSTSSAPNERRGSGGRRGSSAADLDDFDGMEGMTWTSKGSSKRQSKSTSGNGGGAAGGAGGGGGTAMTELYLRNRLPRVMLAARLEKELMALWTMNSAQYFHYPVDATLFPTYRTIVANPISLIEIREKIAQYHYTTAQSLVQDMRQLVDNAVLFNGANHAVAVAAKKVFDLLVASLEHERKHFGPEKDSLAQLERAIETKEALQLALRAKEQYQLPPPPPPPLR